MAIHLRRDVELLQSEDGLQLHDRLTGVTFELEPEFSFLLRPDRDPADNEQQWNQLRSFALLDEQLSADEIHVRQREARRRLLEAGELERLRKLLAFCAAKVPYYRSRVAAYEAAKVKTLADLAALPLMHKRDLRENMPSGMVANDFDLARALSKRTAEIAATSGTTGERLQVVVDTELPSVPSQYAEIWNIPDDGEATPRTAVLTGPLCVATECHLGKLPMEERIRAEYTLVLNSADDLFSVKRELIENVAEEMHRFRPDLLLVNPFYLHWLARQAQRYGIGLPPIKLVLSSYQYLSELQRRGIQKLLGAPVLNYYAATDLGGSKAGIECHRGRLHVRQDQSLIEVVRSGRPCGFGELGSLAVTTLESRVMPLVRYLVGDAGKRVEAPCDCAIQDWPVLELHGRSKDSIFVNGRWLTTREVDQRVAQLSEIDFYKCVQSDDELRFEVVFAPDVEQDQGPMERQLAELFETRVRVRPAKRLDPEPSLKFRLTQSLTHPGPEIL